MAPPWVPVAPQTKTDMLSGGLGDEFGLRVTGEVGSKDGILMNCKIKIMLMSTLKCRGHYGYLYRRALGYCGGRVST